MEGGKLEVILVNAEGIRHTNLERQPIMLSFNVEARNTVAKYHQVKMTSHGGMRSSYLISHCVNGESITISNLESWTRNYSEKMDLLVKP